MEKTNKVKFSILGSVGLGSVGSEVASDNRDIRSLNGVIGKFYLLSTVLKTGTEKTKIEKKGP